MAPTQIAPTGPRVTIVPGRSTKPAEAAPQTKKPTETPPPQHQLSKKEQEIEARIQRRQVLIEKRIFGNKAQLTSQEFKQKGYGEAGTGFFDAAGEEEGATDGVVTREEFRKSLKAAMPSDVIRALVAQGKSPEEIAEAILQDYKTAKQIRWVACQQAAEEYANKYGTSYYDSNGLKVQEWLDKGCSPGLKTAAASLAKAIIGDIKPESRLTAPQFALVLYTLAILSSTKEPAKYGFTSVAKLEGDSPEAILRWVTKGSGTEVKAADKEEASEAGTSDSAASGVAAGDKKITEGEKHFDSEGRLKPGADLSAAVKLYKEALDEYKKDINSGGTEIRKHARNNAMVAASRLLRYDAKDSPQYLQEISNIYKANIKDSPDDLDSKTKLVDVLIMQSSAKQERALNKSIPEQIKTEFENESTAFIEEARTMARTTEKDLLKKVDEVNLKLKEAGESITTGKKGEDNDKLVDELTGLEQKLKQTQERLNEEIPLPGQLKFEMTLQDKEAPMENDVKAHDNFVLELEKSLSTSTLEKADKFRIHLQLAQTEIRRGNYKKVKEHCQKALTFYDDADKGLKERAKIEIKETIEQMCQLHDKQLAGYAKEMVETLNKKGLLVELAIKYNAFKRKGGKTSTDTEEISINRPADMVSVLKDSHLPLKSEVVIEYLLAVKSGNFDEVRPELLARLAEKKQDTPQKREAIRLLQKKRFLLRVAYILINDNDYKELVTKEPKLNMGKDWTVAQRLNWLQTVVKKDYSETKKSELSKDEKKTKKH